MNLKNIPLNELINELESRISELKKLSNSKVTKANIQNNNVKQFKSFTTTINEYAYGKLKMLADYNRTTISNLIKESIIQLFEKNNDGLIILNDKLDDYEDLYPHTRKMGSKTISVGLDNKATDIFHCILVNNNNMKPYKALGIIINMLIKKNINKINMIIDTNYFSYRYKVINVRAGLERPVISNVQENDKLITISIFKNIQKLFMSQLKIKSLDQLKQRIMSHLLDISVGKTKPFNNAEDLHINKDDSKGISTITLKFDNIHTLQCIENQCRRYNVSLDQAISGYVLKDINI